MLQLRSIGAGTVNHHQTKSCYEYHAKQQTVIVESLWFILFCQILYLLSGCRNPL